MGKKLTANKAREHRVSRQLRLGWRVLRLWECSLHTLPTSCVYRIEKALTR